MSECSFLPIATVANKTIWRCSACGFVTIPVRVPPRRNSCPGEPTIVRKTPSKQQGDVLSHWLTCQHRGPAIYSLPGSTVGGCPSSAVEVYQCRRFAEPVLKHAAARCLAKITARVPGYTGRTCRECKVPRESAADVTPVGTTKPACLPLADGALTTDPQRGVITGAHAAHWPCLGALALGAHRNVCGFAVADHGLSDWQRKELDRVGVRWITHEQPDLSNVRNRLKIVSEMRAWWKPWVCLASPFDVTAWIDSDAVVTGDLAELFAMTERGPCVSTQRLWMDGWGKLYREMLTSAVGMETAERWGPDVTNINSGVVAWRRGDTLLTDWRDACFWLMTDPDLSPLCPVRDQAGLALALVIRSQQGRDAVTLLGDEWNVPADYLPGAKSKHRKPVSLNPEKLLAVAIRRHPMARVVHWLGGMKPWKIKGSR